MASQYRDPITIQNLKTSASPNQLGEPAVDQDANYETYFECFGEVIVKGSREFTKAGIVNADVSHLIRVPFSTETLAVTHEHRIVLEATAEKLHVEDAYRRDSGNREVEILCRS